MSNSDEILIVLGSKRFASNTDKDVWIQAPLIGDRRTMVEGDRTRTINLEEQFNQERQNSDVFRISGKITNIFQNSVSGKTTYTPYRNSLYYTNAIANATSNIPPNPNVAWEGYPQFDEFIVLRTSGITGHVPFVPKSSTTYNWSCYVSYPFSSDTQQLMSSTNETYNVTNNFIAGDGIPFVIDTNSFNGKNLVYFYCGTIHNLSVGDYVELNIPSNPTGLGGKTIFQVYLLGDGNYGTEDNVFAIYDLKFPSAQTTTGTMGTFKRIVNISNVSESKSLYYVRLHKIITNISDCNISQAGFENNPFSTKTKLEYSALTPNKIQRVSMKEGSKTFSYTINKDISISGFKDNNGKPITELFFTMIQRGYMGWFNPPAINQFNQQTAIDIGWGFNFLENSIDTWWDHSSTNNKDSIPLGNYEFPSGSGQFFYFNDFLKDGDIIKGDFCEYNNIEQQEYVISKMYHKYSFNNSYFYDTATPNYPSGYVYEPHHSIKIRVFSDYLEFGNPEDVDNIPNYAWFSTYENTFFWKDLYTYGYIDGDGLGLDYPFINGSHYPFQDILLLQKPIQRTTKVNTTLINNLTNDNCE
jgi:hypothetical protein